MPAKCFNYSTDIKDINDFTDEEVKMVMDSMSDENLKHLIGIRKDILHANSHLNIKKSSARQKKNYDMRNAMPMKLAVGNLVLKIRQKNLGRKGGRLDDRTKEQLYQVVSIMYNGNLQLQGEKSKEMYPHSVPLCQVKRFLLKKRSFPTSLKYVETNSKVQKTSSNSTHGISSPFASASTSKLVSSSTSPEYVETNANLPNTITNSILPTSSPSAPGCQSTSMFVHHTLSNHMVDKTAQNMASNPTATFSSCSNELIGSPAPSVTTMLYKFESTHTVISASVSNTNIHRHPQLRTTSNTIETHATVISTSTLKLNFPLKIKLPPNILTLASRGILKSTKSIPLRRE